MKSDVETLNPTRVKLTVEVPFDELKPSLDKAYKTIAGQVNVPGFRKGKVPPRIIDQRVGRGAVLEEAVNDALPKLYAQAVEASEVRPLGRPEVDVTEVPDPATGGDLKFTAEVDVRPEITLPDLASLEVVVETAEVSDDDVTERLDALRTRFASTRTAERPAVKGDFLTIDITAVIDGETIDSASNISYELGSGTMLAGMDDVLEGLSADEETTYTTPLAGGDRAGQDAEVTLKVTAVKERVLPEADDDFASESSEFDTLDELLADLRTKAVEAKRFAQGMQARERLVEVLLEAVEIPVPDAVVEDEVNQHLESEGRLADDEHRAEVSVDARKNLQTQLLLDAIAESKDVQIAQRDVADFLVTNAQQYGMDPNEFARRLDEAGQISVMIGEIARRKGLMAVLAEVTVKDEAGAVVDLSDLFPVEETPEADEDDDAPEVAAAPASVDPSAVTVTDEFVELDDETPADGKA